MIQHSFLLAAIFYLLSFCGAIAGKKHISGILLITGLLANGYSIAIRYWLTFPMLPLYQGPFFLPFFMGLFSLKALGNAHHSESNILLLISLMAWAALFFPNDHYLPFIQFRTIFSHLFFLFGVIARAFFILSGLQAYQCIRKKEMNETALQQLREVRQSVIWGYLFWTISVFCGAIWSYLGWGSPVVWEDPAITTAMATWLYYSLYLHLHLISFVNAKNRPFFAVIGACWVIAFNCLPDMGKFMLPNIFMVKNYI